MRSFYAHTDIPMRRPAKEATGLPARFTASIVGSEGIDAEVSVVANLGEPLVDKGGKVWDLVGVAVHAYLGLPLSSLTEEWTKDDAERILQRWIAGTVFSGGSFVDSDLRWIQWLATHYLDAEVHTLRTLA